MKTAKKDNIRTSKCIKAPSKSSQLPKSRTKETVKASVDSKPSQDMILRYENLADKYALALENRQQINKSILQLEEKIDQQSNEKDTLKRELKQLKSKKQ